MPSLNNVQTISTLGQTRTVSFTATAAQQTLVASPLSDGPKTFLLLSDQDCYVRQGSNPTADSSDFLLKANTYVRVTVQSADDSKISVIRSTDNGTLYITENSGLKPGNDPE